MGITLQCHYGDNAEVPLWEYQYRASLGLTLQGHCGDTAGSLSGFFGRATLGIIMQGHFGDNMADPLRG